MPLTDVVVRKAEARPASYKLPDGRGLYLLVMPNGRKYWRMRCSWRGKENTPAFGVYPDVSLKMARMKRDEARLTLAQGLNPKTGRCFGTWWPGGRITWSDWLRYNLNREVNKMISVDIARKDTIDVEPAEFFRMKRECPGEIASFHVLPPVLGKSNNFGKVRVKLSTPRYEVRL